ncbi:hypothetical protein [Thioclava sp. F28-4]|uniref:hypothetical protein n=1 Tax=Thioclava sp. F28-4 TaxID=1915315 RepID=UPI000997F072|nr:hypothetical protein [Thioclava sp. F28-4]OOY05222.1 hypothetical protein BMI87_09440 [Thioclava sp. F28-4]
MNEFEEAVIAERYRDLIFASLANGIVSFAFGVLSFAILPIYQALVATLMVMAVFYGMTVSRGLKHNQDSQARMTALRDLRHLELIALNQPCDEEASLELSQRADAEMLQVMGKQFDLLAAARNIAIYIAFQVALLFASAWLGTSWSMQILNFLAKVEVFFH